MTAPSPLLGRRAVLVRLTHWGVGATGCLLLGGCGDGAAAQSDAPANPTTVAAGAEPAASATLSGDAQRLNLVLNLAYLSAQFHARASGGAGLPAAMQTGCGRQGTTSGGAATAFVDPLVAGAAATLADDKQAQVAALRTALGASAAAMPAIDLAAARGVTAIDPSASDGQYLLGAFLIDDAVAAVHRALLPVMQGSDATTALQASLAGSIHQGGLLRTLLDRGAAADPTIAAAVSRMCTTLSSIDGSGGTGQALADADTGSANLTDAQGRPIPFTRTSAQALRLAFLNTEGRLGGFFPQGLNGVA